MSGFSICTWCSDMKQYMDDFLPSVVGPFQLGYHTVQPIVCPPEAKAKNIGHAYNKARSMADHQTRIFAHQDITIRDRHFLDKLDELLSDPKVGAVGIIGSTVDTGGGFFHTHARNKRGIRYAAFYPERSQVKLVDGFLLATREDYAFSEEYETTHMAIEDFCMQVRQAGKQVWTLDASVDHKSGGTLDGAYWRSVATFRRKWRHMLPAGVLGVDTLKARPLLGVETISMNVSIDICEEDE